MYATSNPQELGQFPRIIIGGNDCKQPYSSLLLNISAMNHGAKMGHFAHSMEEEAISDYHLQPGDDLNLAYRNWVLWL
ncbi:MAG: hypothetical protein ACJAU2_000592 [Maribacter sp.]|jgi:hypothetical protein